MATIQLTREEAQEYLNTIQPAIERIIDSKVDEINNIPKGDSFERFQKVEEVYNSAMDLIHREAWNSYPLGYDVPEEEFDNAFVTRTLGQGNKLITDTIWLMIEPIYYCYECAENDFAADETGAAPVWTNFTMQGTTWEPATY